MASGNTDLNATLSYAIWSAIFVEFWGITALGLVGYGSKFVNVKKLLKGDIVNGRGDTPNKHDALTGTMPDGRAFPPGEDKTCKNWTSSMQGTAIVGHIDRTGLDDSPPSHSWNSSHPSRGPDGGCRQTDLRSTGGDGLFYCFAAN